MRRYVLFDLDGTLTDPFEGITGSVQYALSAFGIEEPDRRKLAAFIGPPLKDSFRDFYGFSEEEQNRAMAQFRIYFEKRGIDENEIYEGIDQLLARLRKEGFILAVATSKPEVFAERILKRFGIRRYFSAVCGSDLAETRVRKGEIIADAVSRLGVNREEDTVLMVGDRRHDAEGAAENRIPCIGVLYGYGNREELTAAGAEKLAETVPALLELLLACGGKP